MNQDDRDTTQSKVDSPGSFTAASTDNRSCQTTSRSRGPSLTVNTTRVPGSSGHHSPRSGTPSPRRLSPVVLTQPTTPTKSGQSDVSMSSEAGAGQIGSNPPSRAPSPRQDTVEIIEQVRRNSSAASPRHPLPHGKTEYDEYGVKGARVDDTGASGSEGQKLDRPLSRTKRTPSFSLTPPDAPK